MEKKRSGEQPVRVAAVIGKMVGGGVESVAFNYCRAIPEEAGVRFDFYYDDDSTAEPPPELLRRGARFFRIPRYQRLPAFLKTLYRRFREERYPIVHSHLNTLSVFPLLAARLAGVPVRICHNHSTAHPGEGKKTLLKKLLRRPAQWFATDFFACGDRAARWMYGDKAVDAGRVTVLKNAVDSRRFRFDPDARQALRAALDIGEGTFVLGHVGRFTYAKNHRRLLEIFAALRRLRPDSLLLLVGEGELLPDVRGRAEELGLADAVRFLGLRQDVNRIYSAMDAFCLPSFYEGLPVVGVELQWNGLPCCLSDMVTQEVLVNPNVRALPLAAPPEDWAGALLSLSRCAPGPGMAEFDISAQAERLSNDYLRRAAETV